MTDFELGAPILVDEAGAVLVHATIAGCVRLSEAMTPTWPVVSAALPEPFYVPEWAIRRVQAVPPR